MIFETERRMRRKARALMSSMMGRKKADPTGARFAAPIAAMAKIGRERSA